MKVTEVCVCAWGGRGSPLVNQLAPTPLSVDTCSPSDTNDFNNDAQCSDFRGAFR